MSNKKTKKAQLDKSAKKKAVVLAEHRKNRKPVIIGAILTVLVAVGAVVYLQNTTNGTSVTATPAAVTAGSTFVSYPTAMFDDGKARHFDYHAGNLNIRYFILKSSDGVLRAAFDACDVCWPAGKGYFQEGDNMVCRNCGRRFASVMVNEVQGGCNPAPLNRRLEGDQLVIEVNDIVAGGQYFDFSRKG